MVALELGRALFACLLVVADSDALLALMELSLTICVAKYAESLPLSLNFS